jgi:hypothetical protein
MVECGAAATAKGAPALEPSEGKGVRRRQISLDHDMPIHHTRLIVFLLAAACVSRGEPSRDSTLATAAAPATPSAATRPDSSARERASARWVVTPRGIGPVQAGMSLATLSETLGEPLRAGYSAGSTCAYVRPAALPADVLVMVERDTVVRIDVRGKGVRTVEGVGVGDTEASVAKAYEGRVRTTPHKYTGPKGHYLTASAPADTSHLIVFETDGSSVVSYHAGSRPAVELVEGCS